MSKLELFFKVILPSAAAGGVLTSTIEFIKQYNLIDLLKDNVYTPAKNFVLRLFGKAKQVESAAETDIKNKL